MGKKANKIEKTNALRLLDSRKVIYEVHEYDIDDGLIDGLSVCNKLGLSSHVSYKTLVAHGKGSNKYVFVIPIEDELDLKKAAKACGEKKIEMLAVKDLLEVTGYIRGGCSPIGMKKLLPTLIDEKVMLLERVYVSGGRKGLTIGISPEDLLEITNAKVFGIVL